MGPFWRFGLGLGYHLRVGLLQTTSCGDLSYLHDEDSPRSDIWGIFSNLDNKVQYG